MIVLYCTFLKWLPLFNITAMRITVLLYKVFGIGNEIQGINKPLQQPILTMKCPATHKYRGRSTCIFHFVFGRGIINVVILSSGTSVL